MSARAYEGFDGGNNEPVSVQLCPSHCPIALSPIVAFSGGTPGATGPRPTRVKSFGTKQFNIFGKYGPFSFLLRVGQED